jgi:hypothetical protein
MMPDSDYVNTEAANDITNAVHALNRVITAQVRKSTAEKLNQIEEWLEHAMGGKPSQLHLTNPSQQFIVTCDLEPLMKLLGGAWDKVVEEAYEKAKAQSGRRAILTEGEEGNFLGAVKRKAPPSANARQFISDADVKLTIEDQNYRKEEAP